MPLRTLACCLAFAALPARADDDKLFPAEAAIPNSRVISIPIFAPAPKAGYPVIYVLDGELYFPSTATASDLLADKALGDKAAVVVGIGHGTFNDKSVIARYARKRPSNDKPADGSMALNAFQTMRNHDFQWPVQPAHRAPAFVENVIGPQTGDLDMFLRVIEKEIKPRVQASMPINRSNQALFGHSLGGLAVVRALFTEPNAFRTFIAASPSIWYDGATVLKDEKQFAAAVAAGRANPRVLITVGALEPDNLGPSKDDLAKFTPQQRSAMISYGNMLASWPGMITGARNLAAQLKALHGEPGYDVEFTIFPGQNHQNSAYPATVRAVQFAFLEK